MLTNAIEISLTASKKMGILPILMRKLGSLGLIYRRCVVEDCVNGVKLTVFCVGDMDADKQYLIDLLMTIPNVNSIISIKESKAGPNEVVASLPTRFQKTKTEFQPLRANDVITQDIMHLVEDRLSESFGPVANILLKNAAKKSRIVGELFLNLAEELTEDQRILFLRDIEGLEQISLSS